MSTRTATQLTITIPDGAPPGSVLSIPVKGRPDPVKVRVPEGLRAGSTLVLTQHEGSSEWVEEVVHAAEAPNAPAAPREPVTGPGPAPTGPAIAWEPIAGAAPSMVPIVPGAVVGLDLGRTGRPDLFVAGPDIHGTGIPEPFQRGPNGTAHLTIPAPTEPVLPAPPAPDPELAPDGPVAYTVRLETSVGTIDIIVRPDWAPYGARRFLELAAHGDLDGLAFYRAVKGCLAQFGLPPRRQWPPLPDDPPTGVPFLLGAVCFAAVGQNARRSTLFVCIGDMSHCFGQSPWETPIGAVAEASLDTLDRIQTVYGDIAECGGKGPDTGRLQAEGNEYLRRNFPLLTYIMTARPLDWPPQAAPGAVPSMYEERRPGSAQQTGPPSRQEEAQQAASASAAAADAAAQAAQVVQAAQAVAAVFQASATEPPGGAAAGPPRSLPPPSAATPPPQTQPAPRLGFTASGPAAGRMEPVALSTWGQSPPGASASAPSFGTGGPVSVPVEVLPSRTAREVPVEVRPPRATVPPQAPAAESCAAPAAARWTAAAATQLLRPGMCGSALNDSLHIPGSASALGMPPPPPMPLVAAPAAQMGLPPLGAGAGAHGQFDRAAFEQQAHTQAFALLHAQAAASGQAHMSPLWQSSPGLAQTEPLLPTPLGSPTVYHQPPSSHPLLSLQGASALAPPSLAFGGCACGGPAGQGVPGVHGLGGPMLHPPPQLPQMGPYASRPALQPPAPLSLPGLGASPPPVLQWPPPG